MEFGIFQDSRIFDFGLRANSRCGSSNDVSDEKPPSVSLPTRHCTTACPESTSHISLQRPHYGHQRHDPNHLCPLVVMRSRAGGFGASGCVCAWSQRAKGCLLLCACCRCPSAGISHKAQKARPADSSEQLAGAIALAKARLASVVRRVAVAACCAGVLSLAFLGWGVSLFCS